MPPNQLFHIQYEDFILGIESRERGTTSFHKVAFLIKPDGGLQLWYDAGPSGYIPLPKLSIDPQVVGYQKGTEAWQIVTGFTYSMQPPYIILYGGWIRYSKSYQRTK